LDVINFSPHVHVLAADGAFIAEGRFVALPPVPQAFLAEGFRREVLDFLVLNDALSVELRSRMLAWRHSGFSAHNEVRVKAEDAEGRRKLAGTKRRARDHPAHPRAPGALGAGTRRAKSARAGPRVAGERRHSAYYHAVPDIA
jgi:hypothetical protein